MNLQTQNQCLLLKHLHKFYNKCDIPWVKLVWVRHYAHGELPRSSTNLKSSFLWKDILKLINEFKGLVLVNVLDEKSCLFWLDLWNNHVLQQSFLELASFSNSTIISVHDMKFTMPLTAHFHLPLSTEAWSIYLITKYHSEPAPQLAT